MKQNQKQKRREREKKKEANLGALKMEKIMGIVINKKEKTMSMADAWIVEDLSSWELVEPSDDENEQDYSYDDDDDDEEIDLYVFESLPSDLAAQSSAQDLVDHASGQEDRVDLVKRVSVDEKCVYTVTEVRPPYVLNLNNLIG